VKRSIRPAGLRRRFARERVEKFGAIPRIHPASGDMPVVEATRPRRQPQFLQRRLRVDDDLAAVRKCELQQSARALRVDVDDVVLQQPVGLDLDGR
jgi:hypothetical protein